MAVPTPDNDYLVQRAYRHDPTRWKDKPTARRFVIVDPQADLEIDTESVLGSGGFGRTMKCVLKRGGGSTGAYEHSTVAVKMLFASNKLSEELLKSFYVDAYQMSQLVHPNIMPLLAACVRPPHLVLVQELVELGRHAPLARRRAARSARTRVARAQRLGAAVSWARRARTP